MIISANQNAKQNITCQLEVEVRNYGENSTHYYSYLKKFPIIRYDYPLFRDKLINTFNFDTMDFDSIKKIITTDIQVFRFQLGECEYWRSYSVMDKYIRVIKKSKGISINGLVIDIKENVDCTEKTIDILKAGTRNISDDILELYRKKTNCSFKESIKPFESIGFYIIIDNNIYYISKEEYNSLYFLAKKEGIEHYQDALNWTPREDSLEGFIHINGDTFYSNTIFYYTSQVVEYDKNYLEQKPFFNLADMDTDRWTLESFLKGMAEGDKEVYNYLQSILSTQDTDAKNYTK